MFKKKQKKPDFTPRRRLPEYSIEDGRTPTRSREVSAEEVPSRQQYRRNQTVSSYKRPEVGDSERQKSHTLVVQRRKLGVVFLGVAGVVTLLLLGLWQFILQPAVVFSNTEITQKIKTHDYETTITDYVARHPAQRFRATINQEALTAYVATTHSEVLKVSLADGLSLPSQVRFTIAFREPVAGWQMKGVQYYVDKDGVVFDRNYFADPGVTVVDESGIVPEQGSAIASTKLLGFLGRVVSQSKGRGYTVTEAILPADTTRRVDVKLEGGETRVRFSTDRGVGVQVEDMDHALRFFSARGEKPQYIDVRVGGRSAYR